jgi:hypothetical protein
MTIVNDDSKGCYELQVVYNMKGCEYGACDIKLFMPEICREIG